jgi:hypothetical protein
MTRMPVYVWIALGLGLLATLAGGAFAASRALRGWRTFRAVSRSVSDALAKLTASATATADRAATVAGRSGEVAAASARLERSLAELAVLRHAADQARASARRVTGLVPRK